MKYLPVYSLIGLLAGQFFFSGFAEAKALATTERQIVEILKDTVSPRAKNPLFRCYHLGRLQGVADRLASDLTKLSSRQTTNPSKQAKLIYAGQKLHLKLETRLASWAVDCDPALNRRNQISSMSTLPVEKQVQFARKKIRGIGAEDPVIGCFQAGRLSVLTDRLENDLHKRAARGLEISEPTRRLLNESSAAIRNHSQDCDRF